MLKVNIPNRNAFLTSKTFRMQLKTFQC